MERSSWPGRVLFQYPPAGNQKKIYWACNQKKTFLNSTKDRRKAKLFINYDPFDQKNLLELQRDEAL